MKYVQKPVKTYVFAISLILFLQSCGVYYKSPISLDEAVKQAGKVKIRTAEGKKIKYKKIIQSDDQFFGKKRKSGKWVQVPLNPADIQSVRLKNKSASTWVTVSSIVVPVGALIILLANADFGIGCIWCGGY